MLRTCWKNYLNSGLMSKSLSSTASEPLQLLVTGALARSSPHQEYIYGNIGNKPVHAKTVSFFPYSEGAKRRKRDPRV